MTQTPRYRPVPAHVDLPAMEREILSFWDENRTFDASLEATRDAPRWTFYEGPPTANGTPGTHHVEARVFKDVFPLEYPVYTKPSAWRERPVPEVLLSGNHGRIARFRRDEQLRRTAARRPDLIEKFDAESLDKADRATLAALGYEVRDGRIRPPA